MEQSSLDLYGQAILDFYEGDTGAVITIRRDDGFAADLPVAVFFRTGDSFSPLDSAALEHCRGSVLDIGAGTGGHSLELQKRGFAVTAVDSVARAVEVMRKRGVRDVRCEDIFRFRDKPFDTALMLGHGIGITGDTDGLDRFLEKLHELILPTGQFLVDSLDVRVTDDPANLAYQEANLRAGRSRGEIRMRFEYKGLAGEMMKWLHIDFESLEALANAQGWQCEELVRQPTGDYLARLTQY